MEKLIKARQILEEQHIDALLITNDTNRRYLTDFTGSAGVVIITKTAAVLVVDFRYVEQAHKQAAQYSIHSVKNKPSIFEETVKVLEELKVSAIGFEQDHMSYRLYTKYQEAATAEMVPLSGEIEKLRMVKSKEEISRLKTAAEISDAAFTHILSFVQPGVAEVDVANELEAFMRKQGAASSSFDMIIASGERSALPHGLASKQVIRHGDMLILDYGAYYEGYRSDMTRTVAAGEPDARLKDIYAVVLEALMRSLHSIKPGITGRQADAFSRQYIEQQGYGKEYGHGSGHGVGLDIHEEPFMSPRCEHIIQPGMVLTVEPGIYVPGLGGVRIEDDILITDHGNEVLTASPRELIIL